MRVIVIGIGGSLLIAALVTTISVRGFRTTASWADGIVVRLNAGGSHPQVEFTATSGQKVSVPQGGFVWNLRAGQKVRVLYDPARPAESARLDSLGGLWFLPLLLALLGTIFVVTGLSMSSEARGRSATAPPPSDSRERG